jgi:hypothetical protein
MYVPSADEIEVLKLIAVRPCQHHFLPRPQRLNMGSLWTNDLVCLRRPDTWVITPQGLAAIGQCRPLH